MEQVSRWRWAARLCVMQIIVGFAVLIPIDLVLIAAADTFGDGTGQESISGALYATILLAAGVTAGSWMLRRRWTPAAAFTDLAALLAAANAIWLIGFRAEPTGLFGAAAFFWTAAYGMDLLHTDRWPAAHSRLLIASSLATMALIGYAGWGWFAV